MHGLTFPGPSANPEALHKHEVCPNTISIFTRYGLLKRPTARLRLLLDLFTAPLRDANKFQRVM